MKASLPYKSIKTRKNGKWYIVFDYKDHSGNRKRKWVNTKLPETCSKKALKEAEESIAEGEIAVKSASAVPNAVMSDEGASEMSLGDFFSEWLTHIKPNVARTTHLCYRKISNRYMEYINENYPELTLGQVNHNHVQNFLNYKLDNGCKGSSVKQYYLALHSLWTSWLYRELTDMKLPFIMAMNFWSCLKYSRTISLSLLSILQLTMV